MKAEIRIVPIFFLIFFSLQFFSNIVTEDLSNQQFHAKSSPNGTDYILDNFNSINSSGDSNVISLDSNDNGYVGCAEFDGVVGMNDFNPISFSSNNSKDIFIFGWTKSSGYWSTTLGGESDDFCWKVILTSDNHVVVGGFFQQHIEIGGQSFNSEGGKDGFVAKFNISSQSWTNAHSFGGLGQEEFRSVIELSNQSFMALATTTSNLSNTEDYLGEIDCSIASPNTNICTYGIYFNKSLQPEGSVTLNSSGHVIGMDLQEIGTTGKTLVIGYFSKIFQTNLRSSSTSISSLDNSNDIFIARIGADSVPEYITSFGSEENDEGKQIVKVSTGFIVGGTTNSTNESPSYVHHPLDNWVSNPTNGGKDILLLRVSTTGIIEDGFTFGSTENDSIGELDVTPGGRIMISGYLGAELNDPATNSTVGRNSTKSGVLAIVNFSGGNSTHVERLFATTGSVSSDARTNSVTSIADEDIVVGGRLTPGSQSNTFFGQYAEGQSPKAGFILRIGLDSDLDSQPHRTDNCKSTYNPNQENYDLDEQGDLCDNDDDNDGIEDLDDDCDPESDVVDAETNWLSNSITDIDGDGCKDSSEDTDDDNDGFSDGNDGCPAGYVDWIAGNETIDRDADGCHDEFEDNDDDADGKVDDNGDDNCGTSTSIVKQISNWWDYDDDGCHNEEDPDIDGDGILNEPDKCDYNNTNWISISSNDHDGDGCRDQDEDPDDDGDGIKDAADFCDPDSGILSYLGNVEFPVWSDFDQDGCHDSTSEDLDDDNDGIEDIDDDCDPDGPMNAFHKNWISSRTLDYDGDGCKDTGQENNGLGEDTDDDNDGIIDNTDNCDPDSNVIDAETNWLSNSITDKDGDGCKDSGPQNDAYGEDIDDDNDGLNDQVDKCPSSSMSHNPSDIDNDGCYDDEPGEEDSDGDNISNQFDTCPKGIVPLNGFHETDMDNDGCDDKLEDSDDDNDNVDDFLDECDPESYDYLITSEVFVSNQYNDFNGNGCKDDSEDNDDDSDGLEDDIDQCDPDGPQQFYESNWKSSTETDYDSDGCKDEGDVNGGFGEDTDDDNDGVGDSRDKCDPESEFRNPEKNWRDTLPDHDNDGCADKEDQDFLDAQEEEKKNERDENRFFWIFVILCLVSIVIYGGVRIVNKGDGNLEANIGGITNKFDTHPTRTNENDE